MWNRQSLKDTSSANDFWGFLRPDGTVGIRNHVAVIPTTGCAAVVAERIASLVPGCVCLVHPHGCDEVGDDADQTLRTLAGSGRSPNVAASLVVGLGCEVTRPDRLVEAIAVSNKPVECVVIQEVGGSIKTIEKGAEIARHLVAHASRTARQAFPISELILATECGGSDATSGLSANPVLGIVSDMMVSAGGTVILSETCEMMGAEHILCERAQNPEVVSGIHRIIAAKEAEADLVAADMKGADPSPGNMAGGITTLEEKSLGCVYKAGTSMPVEVVAYAQRPTLKGLVIMDTPGEDITSLTGMVAGGAQIAIFTTGRGSPAGNAIAPVIKVTGNPLTAERMSDNIDLSTGRVTLGIESPRFAAKALFDLVVSVSSGEMTKAETIGHREFGIWRIGPSF
jgi:altronate dehydratase large subunit